MSPIRFHFSSDHAGDAAACRRPHSRALIGSNFPAAPFSIPEKEHTEATTPIHDMFETWHGYGSW
jgi:hypothetical protein